MSVKEREHLAKYRDAVISQVGLRLSLHCQGRLAENGVSDQLALTAAAQGQPFEVARSQDGLKVAVRFEDKATAHCVVVSRGGVIITYWSNRASDQHFSLRLGEYQGQWAWWREAR